VRCTIYVIFCMGKLRSDWVKPMIVAARSNVPPSTDRRDVDIRGAEIIEVNDINNNNNNNDHGSDHSRSNGNGHLMSSSANVTRSIQSNSGRKHISATTTTSSDDVKITINNNDTTTSTSSTTKRTKPRAHHHHTHTKHCKHHQHHNHEHHPNCKHRKRTAMRGLPSAATV